MTEEVDCWEAESRLARLALHDLEDPCLGPQLLQLGLHLTSALLVVPDLPLIASYRIVLSMQLPCYVVLQCSMDNTAHPNTLLQGLQCCMDNTAHPNTLLQGPAVQYGQYSTPNTLLQGPVVQYGQYSTPNTLLQGPAVQYGQYSTPIKTANTAMTT